MVEATSGVVDGPRIRGPVESWTTRGGTRTGPSSCPFGHRVGLSEAGEQPPEPRRRLEAELSVQQDAVALELPEGGRLVPLGHVDPDESGPGAVPQGSGAYRDRRAKSMAVRFLDQHRRTGTP